MKLLRAIADNENPTSRANAFRRARFRTFLELIAGLPRPVRIVDIGGTESYWHSMGLVAADEVEITLVNIVPVPVTLPNFTALTADACDLSLLADRSFDVAFSNSAIEHVPTPEGQRRMAAEIRRLAPRYYVQTPNRYFPLEPHYLFPFFQFLPVPVKASLLRTTRLGWAARAPTWKAAVDDARSIRLLDSRGFSRLFPDGVLSREMVAGLCKSLMVTRR